MLIIDQRKAGKVMCKKQEENTSVCVEVNVTKIVKYVCITAVLIVACIFGEKCCKHHYDANGKA